MADIPLRTSPLRRPPRLCRPLTVGSLYCFDHFDNGESALLVEVSVGDLKSRARRKEDLIVFLFTNGTYVRSLPVLLWMRISKSARSLCLGTPSRLRAVEVKATSVIVSPFWYRSSTSGRRLLTCRTTEPWNFGSLRSALVAPSIFC